MAPPITGNTSSGTISQSPRSPAARVDAVIRYTWKGTATNVIWVPNSEIAWPAKSKRNSRDARSGSRSIACRATREKNPGSRALGGPGGGNDGSTGWSGSPVVMSRVSLRRPHLIARKPATRPSGTVETVRWEAFAEACPEIATLARERFARDELLMLGTIRRDGSPRVSPCEVDFEAGRIILGMMWRSRKALDLLRDPRATVHSVPTDRMNRDGDVKLYGTAMDEQDPVVRRAYHDEIIRRIDWAPKEPSHPGISLDE